MRVHGHMLVWLQDKFLFLPYGIFCPLENFGHTVWTSIVGMQLSVSAVLPKIIKFCFGTMISYET